MNKPPFQSVTIGQRPWFLPPYLDVIVFETCMFCGQELINKGDWMLECPEAPQEVAFKLHQKRLVFVDQRPAQRGP